MKTTLKVKLIHPKAKLPEYSHPGDSGMDLFTVENKVIRPGETALVRTGIKIELSKNTEAQIRPRSGLALKHQVTVLNSPGTIDRDYRGEVGVILINLGKSPFNIEPGMRIAQIVVKPTLSVRIRNVKDLNETRRGSGGFGSTGLTSK